MDKTRLMVIVGTIVVAGFSPDAVMAEIRQSKACRVDGMSVVRGMVVFGAEKEWFYTGDFSEIFHLDTRGALQLLRVGPEGNEKYLSAKSDGTVFLGTEANRNASWSYLGHVSGVDEWMTSFVHNEFTVQWHSQRPEQPLKPFCLQASDEPLNLRDKDGVDRKVFPAVLVRGDRRRHLVTAVEPSKYSPSLAANDSYGLGNLCVVQGEVFFTLGQVPFGNFSRDNSAELWALDGNLIAVWMKDKWWFLSTDDDGFAMLLEKPKLSSLWDVNPPKKEEKEGSIRREQDDRTSLSLAPSGDPVIRTDRNGNDVQLRRAKLQQEPHKVRIVRVAR